MKMIRLALTIILGITCTFQKTMSMEKDQGTMDQQGNAIIIVPPHTMYNEPEMTLKVVGQMLWDAKNIPGLGSVITKALWNIKSLYATGKNASKEGYITAGAIMHYVFKQGNLEDAFKDKHKKIDETKKQQALSAGIKMIIACTPNQANITFVQQLRQQNSALISGIPDDDTHSFPLRLEVMKENKINQSLLNNIYTGSMIICQGKELPQDTHSSQTYGFKEIQTVPEYLLEDKETTEYDTKEKKQKLAFTISTAENNVNALQRLFPTTDYFYVFCPQQLKQKEYSINGKTIFFFATLNELQQKMADQLSVPRQIATTEIPSSTPLLLIEAPQSPTEQNTVSEQPHQEQMHTTEHNKPIIEEITVPLVEKNECSWYARMVKIDKTNPAPEPAKIEQLTAEQNNEETKHIFMPTQPWEFASYTDFRDAHASKFKKKLHQETVPDQPSAQPEPVASSLSFCYNYYNNAINVIKNTSFYKSITNSFKNIFSNCEDN